MRTSASPRSTVRHDATKIKAPSALRPARRFPQGEVGAGGGLNGTETHATAGAIETCVRHSLEQYFVDLDGSKPHALHNMVTCAFERPLLAFAMEKSRGNQSAAAALLGINRNTLRKKLTEYGLG